MFVAELCFRRGFDGNKGKNLRETILKIWVIELDGKYLKKITLCVNVAEIKDDRKTRIKAMRRYTILIYPIQLKKPDKAQSLICTKRNIK